MEQAICKEYPVCQYVTPPNYSQSEELGQPSSVTPLNYSQSEELGQPFSKVHSVSQTGPDSLAHSGV